MGSNWVRSITSPLKKACRTLFIPSSSPRQKKKYSPAQSGGNDGDDYYYSTDHGMNLHGEVMACGYEDVRVMWSILDKSTSVERRNPTS